MKNHMEVFFMRIMLPIVMAVLLCVLLISCGAKDVSAPTDTPTESIIQTEGSVETDTSENATTPTDTASKEESQYIYLGGTKSDVAPECRVLVKEVEKSEYCFVEDKDSRSGYSLKVSEKKRLPCGIANKGEVDTQSEYGETIASGSNINGEKKISYTAIRRTEPASDENDVYFIYVDYGCKNCRVEFLTTLSTKNETTVNDDKVTEYAAKIIKQIDFHCPTCCE